MRGYSLLEIIIVIAIAAILLAISVMAYSAFLDRQRLNKAAEEVVTIIQKARAMTISSYDATGGVTTFGRQYCVQLNGFNDPVPGDPNNNKLILDDTDGTLVESYTVSEGVIVYSVLVNPDPGIPREVCFKRLSGDAFVKVSGNPLPLSSATITLKSQSSLKTRTVTVSSTGV